MASESAEDWEESYVLVELRGIIEQDWVQKAGETCKFLGIETEQPLLQFGRYVFMGEYQDLTGTAVLLEQGEDETSDEEEEEEGEERDGHQQWKYKCHTFKKCSMQRAFLAEKEDTPSGETQTAENTEGAAVSPASGTVTTTTTTTTTGDVEMVETLSSDAGHVSPSTSAHISATDSTSHKDSVTALESSGDRTSHKGTENVETRSSEKQMDVDGDG